MNRDKPSRVTPDSNLVVVYFGTDPHYHRPDPNQPNRPICTAIRSPGVLTTPSRAGDSGLIGCNQCWPNQPCNT